MIPVLDASAFLACLNDEPGGEAVLPILDHGALISAVNLSEVLACLARAGLSGMAVQAMVLEAGIQVLPFDAEDAEYAADLAEVGRPIGLSLGDRACLGLAMRLGGTAVTADRAWMRIADHVSCDIHLIR